MNPKPCAILSPPGEKCGLAINTLQDIEEQIDDEGIIHVSADDPNLNLQALLFGYADRDPQRKEPITLTWTIEGDGSVSVTRQTNSTDGVFNTKLLMPSTAGSRATVKATLTSNDENTEVLFATVVVDPGVPANISSTVEGTVGIAQSRDMSVKGTVTDNYGNAVAEGTPIRISVGGEALQRQDTELTINNGQFETAITGGEFADDANILEIEVNGAYSHQK